MSINNNIDNNNKNSNEKNTNKAEISIPAAVPLVPVEPVKVKRAEFECPMCHEEYGGGSFCNSFSKGDYYNSCRKCNLSLKDKYHFICFDCHASFCDGCSKIPTGLGLL